MIHDCSATSDRLNSSRAWLVFVIAGLSAIAVRAADFKVGDTTVTVGGRVTAGASFRMEDPDPFLVISNNGPTLGLEARAAGGGNSDDGNLNFRKGDTTSAVVKGVGTIGIRHDTWTGQLRAKAWDDFYMNHHGFEWGNSANGYAAGQPLEDGGYDRLARFSGVALMDAWIANTWSLNGTPVFVRAGQQQLPWGERVAIAGGLRAYKPADGAAAVRPGASAEETYIPVPALFTRVGITDKVDLEAYWQVRFRSGEIPGCGTFNSPNDYVAQGCNFAYTGTPTGSDRVRHAAGAYFTRGMETPDVSDSGLVGIGATWRADAIDAVIGAYAARYASPNTYYSIIKATRVGSPQITGNPGGGNTQYFTEHFEGLRVFALTFEKKFGDWATYGELSYRPNQPLQMNSTDLTSAQTSNTTATQLRAAITATPPGGILHGAEQRKVSSLHLGTTRTFARVLGADTFTLGGELAVKTVHDLPDPTVRRYGRTEAYGAGPVDGVCLANAVDVIKQCSSEGFVSRHAWGYRVAGSMRYANVMSGLDLSPGVVFAHDVKGWSYDGVFSEGRQSVALSLTALWERAYFVSIGFTGYWSGRYSSLRDKDFLSVSAGATF